jgi:hypothetical protein
VVLCLCARPSKGDCKSGIQDANPQQPPASLLQAFCTSLNWGSNLVVGATFPAMLASLGIAGALCLMCDVHAVRCARFVLLGGRLGVLLHCLR